RPGELTGLRWPLVDLDSEDPSLWIAERASEVNHKYVGQADPKTRRKGGIGLHPLAVESRRHAGGEGHLWALSLPAAGSGLGWDEGRPDVRRRLDGHRGAEVVEADRVRPVDPVRFALDFANREAL